MRPDETAVPPAVGSLALSPSLQGLFLCRLPYPLLRVSSSCLCPVSLAPFSLFSFPFPLFSCVSVSPCLSSGLSASPYSLHFPLLSPPSTFSDFYLTLSFSSLRLSAPLSVHFPFSSPPLHLTSPHLSCFSFCPSPPSRRCRSKPYSKNPGFHCRPLPAECVSSSMQM